MSPLSLNIGTSSQAHAEAELPTSPPRFPASLERAVGSC